MTPSLNQPFEALAKLKGNSLLLPVYAAIIAEARQSMDDWIPAPTLPAFKELAGRYGLTVIEDCIFEPLSEQCRIDSLSLSPTTHARGLPMRNLDRASPTAQVHVFVARRREWAEAAFKTFSYPVAIPTDRLLVRPRVDASRVGAAFGYPPCCVASFMRWNNWLEQSHFSKIYRLTRDGDWRANCLPRNTPFMTIFHVPCHPLCQPTREMSQQVVEAVCELDPDYGESIIRNLRGTFLIVNEAFVCKLHGASLERSETCTFHRAELVVPQRSIAPPYLARLKEILTDAVWIEIAEGIITTRTRDGLERFYELDPANHWVDDPCLVSFE